MADAFHLWGSDLSLSATGDLLAAGGSEATRQRVIRRLLSARGDLVFEPAFGAGLPARIGTVGDEAGIEATVRSQMFAEEGVAVDPPPSIRLSPIPGGVSVHIAYRDPDTGEAMGVGMDVER